MNFLLNDVSNFVWTYIITAIMVILALRFTIKLRFVQLTMLKEMFRTIKYSTRISGYKQFGSNKNISSLSSFLISLASRVGVGNLAGVAIAITIGGAGAIFWMWIVAILNASTAFIEATLAQLYKSRSKDAYIGGPAYYIQRGLKNRFFAIIIAALTIITFSFTICSLQANTIAISAYEAFGLDRYISALIIAVLTFAVIFGGVQRISKVSSIIVPIMALAYIFVALWVVLSNIKELPSILNLILDNAFGLSQISGGVIAGAFMQGTKRGLFSNEAGMGSAPNAAAVADVPHPVNQGLMQALGVFVDTLVICSCTAFIIFNSFDNIPDGVTGIALTQFALGNIVGSWAYGFIAVIIFFFGFSTCISNAYYGESNMRFIADNRYTVNTFRLLAVLIIAAGAVIDMTFIWAFADFLMIFIVVINMVSIAIMSNRSKLLLDDYNRQRLNGVKTPEFNKENVPKLNSPEVECW